MFVPFLIAASLSLVWELSETLHRLQQVCRNTLWWTASNWALAHLACCILCFYQQLSWSLPQDWCWGFKRIYGYDWMCSKENWIGKVELKAAGFPLAVRCQLFWLNHLWHSLIAMPRRTQESMCCAPSHPFHVTARAGWLLGVFCTVDVAVACLICSFLCFGQQKSLFSIPVGTNVTVLVPSEAAIKNLSNADKDFWLTPYTLPFLVRYEEPPAFALLGQTTATEPWKGFFLMHDQ